MKCSHQVPFSAIEIDSGIALSLKKNLPELFGGNGFLEPAIDWPVVPTAGPRDIAWGEKVTFVLEKASRWAL